MTLLCGLILWDIIWEAAVTFSLCLSQGNLLISQVHTPAWEGGMEPTNVLSGGEPAWTLKQWPGNQETSF